jgi:hypothetical protein
LVGVVGTVDDGMVVGGDAGVRGTADVEGQVAVGDADGVVEVGEGVEEGEEEEEEEVTWSLKTV